MTIITNYYSPETIYTAGEIVSIFLIVILIITLLISDTKYWNKQIADTFDVFSTPLLLVFIAIIIFKMITVK